LAQEKTGEIISRFNDASKVRDAISGATLTIMVDTLMAIVGGAILYAQNSFMFGITVIIAVLYFILVISFNTLYRKQNREQMEDNAQLTSYLYESLNGIQTVKAFNSERRVNENTENKFIKLLRSVFKLGTTNNVQGSLQGFINGVGGIVILWVGASQVMKGDLSIGELVAFNSLLVYFLDPIKNLINLQPSLQTATVAAERLGEILDLEVERTEAEEKKMAPTHLKGNIELKDITFRYGTRKTVLEDINMHIKEGEKIALVGESGSGKTTLVKLLLYLYEWEKGEILIDGNNIKDIKIESIREKIAFVPQETFLFSGSIYDNLILGIEDANMEQVVKVAKMTKAHDFINKMPLRYNTSLEENGTNLSGGQRQRLAITRALLKNPDILILDEATSNLDSITEKAIEKTIDEYTLGITTIIIAHRLSTIKRCDTIYVMEEGKIIESGSHEKLMIEEGRYYDMWKEQIPDYENVSLITEEEQII
jgi:ATP-binding cassette subfamily B protein